MNVVVGLSLRGDVMFAALVDLMGVDNHHIL